LPPEARESIPVAVGHKPEPFASVRGTNGGCGEQTPFRIKPEDGKVAQDTSEPSGSNNVGDVLQVDVARSHLSDDASSMRPEVSLVIKSGSFAGGREGLARESASDDVNESMPGMSVEGGEVIPDRGMVKSLFGHPCCEYGRGVGVTFDVADGLEDVAKSEGEASVSGAKFKHPTHSRRNHPRQPFGRCTGLPLSVSHSCAG
jgi:hypothetical protein